MFCFLRGLNFVFFLVENESHCDFVKLREMLIRTNMQDLIEKTHSKHYELYRCNRLVEMGFTDSNSLNGKILSISETYEAKQTELKAEIQKREDEIKEAFVTKVKCKEAELKEAEKEVCFVVVEGNGVDLIFFFFASFMINLFILKKYIQNKKSV
jgi:septin family protein